MAQGVRIPLELVQSAQQIKARIGELTASLDPTNYAAGEETKGRINGLNESLSIILSATIDVQTSRTQ